LIDYSVHAQKYDIFLKKMGNKSEKSLFLFIFSWHWVTTPVRS